MKVTTTDATPVKLGTLKIADTQAGVIQATVVGIDAAGLAVTGTKIVRYKKAAGTLTLGTPADIAAVVADSGLTAATFTFVANGNNVDIQLTGTAGKTIKWTATIRHTFNS